MFLSLHLLSTADRSVRLHRGGHPAGGAGIDGGDEAVGGPAVAETGECIVSDADIARLRADARGAAELRRAFNRAAEGFCAAGPLPPNHQHVWAAFYAAIIGSEAGLKSFAESYDDEECPRCGGERRIKQHYDPASDTMRGGVSCPVCIAAETTP